jgi:gamma-glutamyltranspeptidase/glutathione hydrolase
MKNLFIGSLLLICFSFACHSPKKTTAESLNINAFQFSIQKKIVCTNGAVVSAHPLASKVGVEILRQGGNAIDAAIATQLALAVVYPNAGNIGGGGFMVARLSNGKLLALDYRETAPLHADRDMYLDEHGNVEDGKSLNGHFATGVPGTVAGLFASAKYGKLSFAKLIQPAIDLALKGFVLTENEASSFNSIQSDLKEYNTVMPVFVKKQDGKQGILWCKLILPIHLSAFAMREKKVFMREKRQSSLSKK